MSGEQTNAGETALKKMRADAQIVAKYFMDFIYDESDANKLRVMSTASIVVGLISTVGGVLVAQIKDESLTEQERETAAGFFIAHLETMVAGVKREVYGSKPTVES